MSVIKIGWMVLLLAIMFGSRHSGAQIDVGIFQGSIGTVTNLQIIDGSIGKIVSFWPAPISCTSRYGSRVMVSVSLALVPWNTMSPSAMPAAQRGASAAEGGFGCVCRTAYTAGGT